MSGETILLIDDDVTLCELLTSYLQTAGYRMVAAPNGPDGLRLATETTPDLVVLDVMMPGMTGWEVCEQLRGKDALPGRHDPIPIIMLTAKSEELDKLRGFRLGVDDYVSKPFSFAELAARVGAVLNRARSIPTSTHTLTSGDLTIDFDGHHVTLKGQSLELTPIEFHLLETLTRHAYRNVPTEKLLVETWGPEYAGEIEHVKHYIWTLRKKIEADPGNPKHILTERGFGYRFE